MGEAYVRHACCRAPALPKVLIGRTLMCWNFVWLWVSITAVCRRQKIETGGCSSRRWSRAGPPGPDTVAEVPLHAQQKHLLLRANAGLLEGVLKCSILLRASSSALAAATPTRQAVELACALAQADGPGACAPGCRPRQHTHWPRHARCAAHDLQRSIRLVSCSKRRATQ